MSVRIRLRRMGAKKRPFYRFVAADAHSPRDGSFREILGYYNPIETPAKVVLKEERIYYWLKQGAIPTETVNSLFHQIGLISKWEKIKKGEDISGIELPQVITERKKKKKSKKRVVKAEVVEEKEEEGKAKAEAKPEIKESEGKTEEEGKAKAEVKPESKKSEERKEKEEEKKKEAKETAPETKKSEKEVEEEKPESEGKKSEKKEPQSKIKDSEEGKS